MYVGVVQEWVEAERRCEVSCFHSLPYSYEMGPPIEPVASKPKQFSYLSATALGYKLTGPHQIFTGFWGFDLRPTICLASTLTLSQTLQINL